MTLTQIKPAGLSKPVDLADNEKIRLGTSNDLEIYHSGTQSFILNNTGHLILSNMDPDADNNIILRARQNEPSIVCNNDGAVELYHDGTKKFETRSNGIEVLGHVLLGDNYRLGLGNVGSNGDLQIYHDGSDSIILDQGTGRLNIRTNGDSIKLQNTDGGQEAMGIFNSNGSVELYHNGSKKFETTSGGVLTTGNTSTTGAFISTQTGGGVLSDNLSLVDGKKVKLGASDDLQIYHNGTDSFVAHIPTSGNLRLAGDAVKLMSNTNDEPYLIANHNGSVELYYDSSKKFQTTSTGVTLSGTIHTIVGDFYPSNDNNDRLGLSNRRWSQVNGYEFNVSEFAKFFDSIKAKFGDGNDLKIYHNGTHSYIDNETGSLYIRDTGEVAKIVVNGNGTTFANTTDNAAMTDCITLTRRGYELSGYGTRVQAMGGSADSQNGIQFAHSHTNGAGYTVRQRFDHDGIKFNGDTAAANALDDYEEGTFTPVYGWSSTSQSGFSFSQNYGRYTKIGRVVHVQIWTNFTATPSSGNAVQVQLPFPSAADAGYRGGISFSWNEITYVGQSSTTQGGRTHLNQNTSWMEMGFRSDVNGGGWSSSAIMPAGMSNGAHWQAEGIYMTNS